MDDRYEGVLLRHTDVNPHYNLPSIMTAYNAVNGTPVSASKFLVDTIARRTYGLDGYITGDCGAIDDILRGHMYAESPEEAAAMGLTSGVDSDCGGMYQSHLMTALEKGLLTEYDLDKAPSISSP